MREMKTSKIEYIDCIPSYWEEKPIRYLFDQITKKNILGKVTNALKFTYGTIIPKTDFDTTDEYVANTILGYTIVNPGTIMINCLNLNYDFVSQRIGLVRDTGAITSAYLAIKPKNKEVVLPEFANYQLKYFDSIKAFHNMGTGVRKTLDFEELGKKYFILPPISDQHRIVSFLDAECAKIDSIHADVEKQIETLEQYKRSIIAEAVTKGLNKNVEYVSCVAKWLPQIPITWNAIKGKYCFVTRNTKGNKKNLELLSPTQKYGVIPQSLYEQYTTQVTVKVNANTNLQTFKTICKGDFCISLRSFEGGFEYSNYDGVVSPAYTVFYPIIDTDRRYYKYLFKISNFITEMNSYSLSLRDGKPISFDDFGNTPIPVPPLEEQIEIADYLDKKCAEIESIIADKKKQLEVLDNYKKSIIYEYVTGKKEVV